MSLSAALNSAVSGLQSQSTAIAAVSGNLANSETVGYKQSTTSFSSLVTGSTGSASGGASGVIATTQTDITTQGLITNTSNSTDLAIDGDGFFVVSDDEEADDIFYTRAGDFSVDDQGLMVNSAGYYLLGYPLDDNGEPTNGSEPTTTSALEPIDLNSISGTAAATENLAIQANLPADAELGDSFNLEVEIFDSLGVSHTVDTTYTKTGANTWSLDIADPTQTGETTPSGTTTTGTIDLVFDTDGTLASTNPDPTELTITGWTSGAADSTIALDLGTPGQTDGLSQFASENNEPDLTLGFIEQDGYRFGDMTSVFIDEEGIVTAEFENGTSQPIYAISLADFPNPDGLTPASDTVFVESVDSGGATLNQPGEGGTGSLSSFAVEASTVDTTAEYSQMIVAQQAYEAAAQVMTVTSEMFDTLNQSV